MSLLYTPLGRVSTKKYPESTLDLTGIGVFWGVLGLVWGLFTYREKRDKRGFM